MEQKLVNFSLPPAPLDEPEMVATQAFWGSSYSSWWQDAEAMRVKKYGESMKLSVAFSAFAIGIERVIDPSSQVLAQPVDPVILRDLGLDNEAARSPIGEVSTGCTKGFWRLLNDIEWIAVWYGFADFFLLFALVGWLRCHSARGQAALNPTCSRMTRSETSRKRRAQTHTHAGSTRSFPNPDLFALFEVNGGCFWCLHCAKLGRCKVWRIRKTWRLSRPGQRSAAGDSADGVFLGGSHGRCRSPELSCLKKPFGLQRS